MLQSRPSSSGAPFSQQHSASRSQPSPRFSSSSSAGSYRGLSSAGLVAPYAFTSTPQLTNNAAFLQNATSPHLRPQIRTVSAPNLLVGNQQTNLGRGTMSARQCFATSSSLSTSSSSSNSLQLGKQSMDDRSISTRETFVDVPARPKSTLGISPSSSMQLASSLVSPKPSPDRYRSGNRLPSGDTTNTSGSTKIQSTSSSPSGSGTPAVGHLYTNQVHPQNDPSFRNFQAVKIERQVPTRNASTDDLNLARPQGNTELAQRYRRRSFGSFDAAGEMIKSQSQLASFQPQAIRNETRDWRQTSETQQPASSHTQHGSSDSVSSTRSARSTGQHSVSACL